MEKLAYALVTSARRLRHYFQSNKIIVKTNQPLRQVLTRPEVSGRLIKWSIELSEFDIDYEPRTAMKAQILADFVAELSEQPKQQHTWELYVDGASNNEGSGAGVLLTNKEDLQLEKSIRFTFQTSNNQAEYEALLARLRLAQSLNITHLQVYCDSQLVVQQVTGHFQVKDQLLEKYHSSVKKLLTNFHFIQITHIAREHNTRADALSKLATTRKFITDSVISQLTLTNLSFSSKSIFSVAKEEDWRAPYKQYIQSGRIPTTSDTKTFRRRAAPFTMIGNELYKRGFSQPLLRCINKEEAEDAMNEAHEGVCGNHIGGLSLASKIARAGFYWPSMKRDCINKVKKCDSYQKHSSAIHNPAEQLHTSEVSWPFQKWGLDILDPFLKAPGQVKYLLVAIYYFSKWIEATPLAKIGADKVRSFIWKQIICRFGIPHHIITDNGRQFTDQSLASFLNEFQIKHHFSSVEHPQTNGLAEAANKVILNSLKKKLGNAKGEWAELIPEVLWGYNTTIQSTTQETPFRLVYGADAMIPVEVSITSARRNQTSTEQNDNIRRTELDTIDEDREKA
ncbi:uncharacterized protein LOC107641282 [Arachis ipaensis]|uniref:uncharacterized protein LOC107641282 n=1 Tax=Arachis ipaensis TaxID=130454 RepID=UPI0007AFD3C5|nr:uncharacterized protein LOC107641282 [Arachis ipaensis]XP_025653269.1 uncharacterized protein LOC112749225 [Arachis hypogaea]